MQETRIDEHLTRKGSHDGHSTDCCNFDAAVVINLKCWGRNLGRGLEREVWPYFVHDEIVIGTHADVEMLEIVARKQRTGGCELGMRENKP